MLIYRFSYVMFIFSICIGYSFAHNAKRSDVLVTETEVRERQMDKHSSHEKVRSTAYLRKEV